MRQGIRPKRNRTRRRARRRRNTVGTVLSALLLEGLGVVAMVALFLAVQSAPVAPAQLSFSSPPAPAIATHDRRGPGSLARLRQAVEDLGREIFGPRGS